MKEEELRSMMRGYIQDATQSEVPNITLLNRMMEDIEEYANQRVVDELEKIPQLMIQPLGEEIRLSSYYVLKRIKELKQ